MRAAQLYYGWAPEGLEARNAEQLIAGSEGYQVRTRELQTEILPWLGYGPGEARGWASTAAGGIVYRRVDSGVDAARREGAFFTHALLFPDGLPRHQLGALYDYAFASAPPVGGPQTLKPVDLADAPQSAPHPALVDDVARLLPGLARSDRGTVVGFTGQAAWTAMSAIVARLPGPIPSFAVGERAPRADMFNLVVTTNGAPGAEVDQSWRLTAQLLLGDDPVDVALRESLASDAGDRRTFLTVLCDWAMLERDIHDRGARAVAEGWGRNMLAFVTQDERRLLHLAVRSRSREVLEVAREAGCPMRTLLAVAAAMGDDEIVAQILSRVPDDERLAWLLEAPIAEDARAALIDEWYQRSATRRRRPSEQETIAVVEALASHRPPRARHLVVGDERIAPAIVASDLPLDLRAAAVLAHPGAFGQNGLIAALAADDLAEAVLKDIDRSSARKTILKALKAAGLDERRHLIAIAGRSPTILPTDLWHALTDVPASQRPMITQALSDAGRGIPPYWGEEARATFAEDVKRARERSERLPEPPAGFLSILEADAVAGWTAIIDAPAAMDHSAVESMVTAVLTMQPSDSRAAMELLCDRLVREATTGAGPLFTVEGVARVLVDRIPELDPVALAVGRAVLRPAPARSSAGARFAILLVHAMVDQAPTWNGPGGFRHVAAYLNEGDRHELLEVAGRYAPTESAGLWLSDALGEPPAARKPQAPKASHPPPEARQPHQPDGGMPSAPSPAADDSTRPPTGRRRMPRADDPHWRDVAVTSGILALTFAVIAVLLLIDRPNSGDGLRAADAPTVVQPPSTTTPGPTNDPLAPVAQQIADVQRSADDRRALTGLLVRRARSAAQQGDLNRAERLVRTAYANAPTRGAAAARRDIRAAKKRRANAKKKQSASEPAGSSTVPPSTSGPGSTEVAPADETTGAETTGADTTGLPSARLGSGGPP